MREATGSGAQPTRIGRYELLARLAVGGMGELFVARLEGAAGFEKLFVVKRILPHLADDTRFRSMLVDEARISSMMSHPNICGVYELGEVDGQLFIAMEYLEGVTLLPLLRKGSKSQTPIDLGLIGGIILQASEALHYAHELRGRDGLPIGVVHRDVTPSNIFLTDSGMVKVLDFGIAKARTATNKTEAGQVKGKYAYMSPEQLKGKDVDRRADVFSLGIVTYELLALRRLFQRKTDYLTFRAAMELPIPDVRTYRADVPAALAEAIERALSRTAAGRFETARAYGTAVVDAISESSRPWTSNQISDYVRQEFESELSARSNLLAMPRRRVTGPPLTSRAAPVAIPAMPAHEDQDDGAEDDVPEVDSEQADGASFPRAWKNADASFGGTTPPPFDGTTSTAGAIRIIDGRPVYVELTAEELGAALARPAAPPRLPWAIAAGLVAVAGAGLGVYALTHHDAAPRPPTVINIQTVTGRTELIGLDAGPTVEANPLDASPGPAPARLTPQAYLRSNLGGVRSCAGKHLKQGDPVVPEALVVELDDGSAVKSLHFRPASLDSTPFGVCSFATLRSLAFQPGDGPATITQPMIARSR